MARPAADHSASAIAPWDLSCPDWKERLRTGRSLVPNLPLFPAGNRAVAVLNKLRLFDVTDTPTMEEAGADWFRDAVRALFGSWDPQLRYRYIRELFMLVPKKNNKTGGGALLMLTALLLNERPRAPFLMMGPVQETAEMAFNAMAGAIQLDPVLDQKLWVRDHLKTIIHRESKASLKITTFDLDMLTGKKNAGALIDEQHVLGKMPRASKAMIQVRGGMEPFPEAFLVTITTQSDEPPSGVFKDDLQKAREIRDGKRTGRTLPILYEFPEEIQRDETKPWRNPSLWQMVNPNLGKSVHLPSLIEAFNDSESKGEGDLRAWASQHLNIEIGLALHANRWTGVDFWAQCAEPAMSLDKLLEVSDVVTIGIDGGGLDDLLGLVVLGRQPEVTGEDGAVISPQRWIWWARAWAHPIALERRKSEAARYEGFAKDGDLIICKNIGEDIEQLVELVLRVEKSELLDNIGVDPAGITDIAEALVAAKIPAERIIGITQGWKLTVPIKTTERRLAAREIVHCDQPMMNWCMSNAKVEARGNAVIITKQISGSAKIDPVLAGLNAVTLMALDPKPRKKKYEVLIF